MIRPVFIHPPAKLSEPILVLRRTDTGVDVEYPNGDRDEAELKTGGEPFQLHFGSQTSSLFAIF
jgi:hypothetical protein